MPFKKTPEKQIILAFHCPMEYEKMEDSPPGKFCGSCQKNVIDLTQKTNEEIHELLAKEEHVCGRVKKSQVLSAPQKTGFFYMRKVLILLGIGIMNTKLAAQVPELSPVSMDSLIDLGIKEEMPKEKEEEFVLGMIMEQMPTYKYGGEKGLYAFLDKNLQFPSDSASGQVIVTFIVDTNGLIKDAKILRGYSPKADAEVLRVIGLLEFIPGKLAGKPAPVHFNLPIRFENKKYKKPG